MSPIQLKSFFNKIQFDLFGCWRWTASLSPSGYPGLNISSHRTGRAHRIAYEHFKGPIPKGMHVHHVCEVKVCVNPDHLMIMTPREHKAYHLPEECKHGHPLKGDNIQIEKMNYRGEKRFRVRCKQCRHDKDNRRNARPEIKQRNREKDLLKYWTRKGKTREEIELMF